MNWLKRTVIRAEEEGVCITVKPLVQIFLYYVSFLVPKELQIRSPYECISNYPDATHIDTLPTELSYGQETFLTLHFGSCHYYLYHTS